MMRNIIMILLITAPFLCFADDSQLYQILTNIITALKAQRPLQQLHAKSNNDDPNKINILKGSWQISYKLLYEQIDKLVINEVKNFEELGYVGTGLYYPGAGHYSYPNELSDGIRVVCLYDPELYRDLGGDYACVVPNKVIIGNSKFNYIVFIFNFSDDTITSGHYGIGVDTIAALGIIDFKLFPLKGFRQPLPNVTDNAEYDVTSKILTIQDTQVGNEHYQVSLKKLDDNRFNLNSATVLTTSAATASAQYNLSTQILSVPKINVQGIYYKADLKNIGNFTFQINSVEQIKP